MVCKNWNIRTVYTGVYPKNMALGQVVKKIVGHVDTVWETKQVYARIIGVRANIHLGGQTEFCPNGFSGGGG